MSDGVAIVGGCGRAGLPLSIAFADAGLVTHTIDINPEAVATVNRGVMPFAEAGAPDALARTIGTTLHATTDPSVIAECEFVVIIIGTPVDERSVRRALERGYRELARSSATKTERYDYVDKANRVRPRTLV